MTDVVSRSLELLKTSFSTLGRDLQAVWLFGSRARGEEVADSDIDLGVLPSPPLGLDRLELMEELSRALACDVEIIDLATASPTMAWEVLTTGRLMLESDALAAEAFLRRTRFDAEDEARRNRMIVLAQSPRVGSSHK